MTQAADLELASSAQDGVDRGGRIFLQGCHKVRCQRVERSLPAGKGT